MASATALAPFERLPYVVLDIICGYLDDESDHRSDLCAFSLTSRQCCAAADTRRFNQIVLVVPDLDDLSSVLDQLRTVLGHGERYGLVHRLKVQGTPPEREPWERVNTYYDDDDKNDKDDDDARSVYRNFDGPQFCRLGHPSLCYVRGGRNHDIDHWLPLATFLRELPALDDLVWIGRLPRCLLDALHDANRPCRLHLTGFHLRSLVYDRDSPRSIDLDEYALVTSPALYSIRGKFSNFDSDGRLDYTKEVLQLMMTGLAPNLTNVWLDSQHFGASLHCDQSIARGRPEWRGFFLEGQTDKEKSVTGGTGSLENLRLDFYLEPNVFNARSMANLRRLSVAWELDTGQALADLAVGGHLPHLEMLSIGRVSSSSEPFQAAVKQILGHTKPLRHLRLAGHFTFETFDLLTRQHGPALRSLLLIPYGGDYYEPDHDEDAAHALFAFSADSLQVMADRCPHLEEVYIEMQRTRGDHDEVGMYRALSRLLRLKRMVLRLECSTDAEPHSIDYLKRTFANCAVDETLARAIFDVISRRGQGALEYLRIESRYMSNDSSLDMAFYNAVRALTRCWVCQLVNTPSEVGVEVDQSGIVVRELGKGSTRQSITECLMEEWDSPWVRETENYEAIFKALWPGNDPPWDGWTSLPLETGEGLSD